MRDHTYNLRVTWTGNDGEGTKTYTSYHRDHTIAAAGKPDIAASSDPSFRGNKARYNPEELLVASLSSCHMLWYLHLCAMKKVTVLDYQDDAFGVMREDSDGSGVFIRVVLKPVVTILAGDDHTKALALHEDAHRSCYIAKSVKFPVEVKAETRRAQVEEFNESNTIVVAATEME